MASITVSTNSELQAAIKASSGDTMIYLKGGNYGKIRLDGDSSSLLSGKSNLTLKAIDSGDPAVFHGFQANDVNGLTLDGLTFHHLPDAGEISSKKNFRLENCNEIKVLNNDFFADDAHGHGGFEDGFGTGVGLFVRHCNDVEVAGNASSNFFRGMVFHYTNDLHFHSNELSNMASDGLNLAGSKDVLVENNYIHDFSLHKNSSAHPDLIQVWSQKIKLPTVNLTIRDNILDIGNGAKTQSIWIRNEAIDKEGAGDEMRYKNFVIENNVIHNAHKNGIAFAYIDGVTIRDNSIMTKTDAMLKNSGQYVTSIMERSSVTGLEIENNNVNRIISSGDWSGKNKELKVGSDEYNEYYANNFELSLAQKIADWLATHQANGNKTDLGDTGQKEHEAPSSHTDEIPHPDTELEQVGDETGDAVNDGDMVTPFPESFDGTNAWSLDFLETRNGNNFASVTHESGPSKDIKMGYFQTSLEFSSVGLLVTAESGGSSSAKISALDEGISVRSGNDNHKERRTIEEQEKIVFQKYDGADIQKVDFSFVNVSGFGSVTVDLYDDGHLVGKKILNVDPEKTFSVGTEGTQTFNEWHVGVSDQLKMAISEVDIHEVA